MSEQGLIVLDVSKFLTLSEEGKRIAEETYARHTFFSDMLQNIGVPKNIATEDACRIEHVISQETFEAIKKYYQYNKGLLFDEQQAEIMAEMDELERKF